MKSVQKWLPYDEILEKGYIRQNNKIIKILEVKPINYNLKSEEERLEIIKNYKYFLNICNFDIQILIQSTKENISSNIEIISSNLSSKSKILEKYSKSYTEYISKVNNEYKSYSKKFYIIFYKKLQNNKNKDQNISKILEELEENSLKIKEALKKCGNECIELKTKKNTLELLDSFINIKKGKIKTYR